MSNESLEIVKTVGAILGPIVIASIGAFFVYKKPSKTKADDMKSMAEAEKVNTDAKMSVVTAALNVAADLRKDIDRLKTEMLEMKKNFEERNREEVKKREELEKELQNKDDEIDRLTKEVDRLTRQLEEMRNQNGD